MKCSSYELLAAAKVAERQRNEAWQAVAAISERVREGPPEMAAALGAEHVCAIRHLAAAHDARTEAFAHLGEPLKPFPPSAVPSGEGRSQQSSASVEAA